MTAATLSKPPDDLQPTNSVRPRPFVTCDWASCHSELSQNQVRPRCGIECAGLSNPPSSRPLFAAAVVPLGPRVRDKASRAWQSPAPRVPGNSLSRPPAGTR
ncbi:hypothetical protein AGIG_G16562 [Arapaima gigas]